MTLAILCSGQGTQHEAMFALTAEAPEAAGVFAAAQEALGSDPRRFIREADEQATHANVAGQILCVTQALAAFAALKDTFGARISIAGYSIGELAAWGCAGLYSSAAVVDLARQRALTMDANSRPGDGLAFVRGLPRDKIDGLCARRACDVAIVNPGEMFVIGGGRKELDRLCAEALNVRAAKAGPLKVNVASHTPRLAGASQRFAKALAAHETLTRRPGVRLFSGIDARPVINVGEGQAKLATQISHTIDWAGCLEACVEAGVDTFLELGPGRALAAMADEAYPNLRARSTEDFRSLEGIRAWLAKASRS
ncbi:ACP S-malonyltransferase [Rhodoblastus sp.]|uniref:ACP S-malonyltransferase n=1 Tax=Rhodoblastus sp. TaxID=1962975 RepID=UPI003F9E52C5